MPVGSKRVLLGKHASIIASTLVLASAIALGQSELDAAHIFPRENPQMLASANVATSPGHMHAIKQNVDLVLVPVSVTDGKQRLVTGLDQSNFQVLEGKKVQEIRHFSNEDAPVSLGVIVDTSGSMKDKVERVREAVTQFCEMANVADEFFMIRSPTNRIWRAISRMPPKILKRNFFTSIPRGGRLCWTRFIWALKRCARPGTARKLCWSSPMAATITAATASAK